MKVSPGIRASLLLGLTVAGPVRAVAQSAAPAAEAPGGNQVAEIVVTANKRQQNLQDVGSTVTAIGAQQLADRHIESLADVAQAVPGLTFAESITNTPVFTLRGVGFYETSLAAYPTTSVYLDEVPLPFSVQTSRTAFDLARIEVLKGPQGTLFGNNATGGAINYVAAKPTPTLQEGLSLGYSNYNTKTADGFVSGPLTDTLGARLAIKAEDSDGWQHSYTRNDTVGKTSYFAGRFLLDWRASEVLKFELNINAWRDRSEPQVPQYIEEKPENPGPGLALNNYPLAPANASAADWTPGNRPRGDNRLAQVALRGDLDLHFATLTSITSYIDYNHLMSFDADGTALQIFNTDPVVGNIKSFSQELRLADDPRQALRWVVGADYSSDRVYEGDHLYFDDGSTGQLLGIGSLLFASQQNMKNYAGFGNIEYDVVPRLTVKAGLRYTEADRSAALCVSDPAQGRVNQVFTGLSEAVTGLPVSPLTPTQCVSLLPSELPSRTPFLTQLNEHNVSWRVGGDWKASRDTLFYVNISRGYKAGSFPTISAVDTAQFVPVRQESVTAYEGGVKTSLFDRRLTLDAAAYYYDYANKQIKTKENIPLFGPQDVLVNIPSSSIRGAEAQATLQPVHGLVLIAAAAYNDATIDRFTGTNDAGLVANFGGTTIPFAPKWQASVSGDYTVPISRSLNLVTGARYFYQTQAPTTIGGTGLFTTRAYGLLDLHGGIATADGAWRIDAYAKNATDTYYWTNVGAANDTIVRYAGRPATYGLTLSAKFN